MAKMQNVNFNSMVEFFDYLPEKEREIVLVLQELILENVPGIKEKLSFNVPFYFGKKSMFFIWPGSVAWGRKKKPGVQLGFAKGYLMEDPSNFLSKGKRKQIYIKAFYEMEELEEGYEIIVQLLNEAFRVDQLL